MSLRWKKIALALLLITAAGAARLPVEHRYTQGMREANLLEKPLNLSLRDELGQSFFIAVLGGFRSMVATVMELRSITPWMRGQFGIVEECYALCTKLQPREEHYWDLRSWHQACNARDNYLWDSKLQPANRQAQAQQCVDRGITILREGVTRLPQSWKLWDRLAWYLCMDYNQQPDRAAAVAAYEKAAAIPGAPGVQRRLAVYQLARIPGREREAWDRLWALYHDPDPVNRMPTVEIELANLFASQQFREQNPGLALPEELFRILTSPVGLTPQEEKHRQRLIEGLQRRRDPEGWRQRAPRISSPTLQLHK